MLAPWKKSYDKPRQRIKKQRCYFSNKRQYSQSYCLSRSMYQCENWTIKKPEHWRMNAFELWCWRRLLDCKEIKQVNSKGNQPWIFIGRTDAEVEVPILWWPDAKSQLIGKDPDPGKDGRQEEKGTKRMRWLDSIIDSKGMSLSILREITKDREAWHAAVTSAKK